MVKQPPELEHFVFCLALQPLSHVALQYVDGTIAKGNGEAIACDTPILIEIMQAPKKIAYTEKLFIFPAPL